MVQFDCVEEGRIVRIDGWSVESIEDAPDGVLVTMRSGAVHHVRGTVSDVADFIDEERKRRDDEFSPFIFTDQPPPLELRGGEHEIGEW